MPSSKLNAYNQEVSRVYLPIRFLKPEALNCLSCKGVSRLEGIEILNSKSYNNAFF